MSKITTSLLSIILLALVSCQSPAHRDLASDYQISKNAQQLVTWETKANAVATRSDKVIEIRHYEIPLKFLQQSIDDSLETSIQESLVFEKNGEKYVRWIINPEDTKWHLELKEFLEKNKLDSKTYKFFDGYLTASRSMIIVNPDNGATFSLKVSTNITGGNWTDKKQTWIDAQQVRRMNAWIGEVMSNMKTDTLVIMDEPMAFGIKEIDQGMIMRSLNDVPKNEHYYMPGFSVLHGDEGARIAKLNGAKDVAEFWNKHYNQPLAKAMAEFFAYTGASYDSPHSQNFLVELDKKMKPTGRIVFRDLGDTYLLADFANNTKFKHLLPLWEDGNVHNGRLSSAVGLLHGNQAPYWLDEEKYLKYGQDFYDTYEKKLSEMTNVPVSELRQTKMTSSYQFSYVSKSYPTKSEAWVNYLKYANCLSGEKKTLAGVDCPEFFLKKQKKIDCAGNLGAILAN